MKWIAGPTYCKIPIVNQRLKRHPLPTFMNYSFSENTKQLDPTQPHIPTHCIKEETRMHKALHACSSTTRVMITAILYLYFLCCIFTPSKGVGGFWNQRYCRRVVKRTLPIGCHLFPLLLLWAGRRRYGAKFCSHHTLSYGSHSAIGFVILVPLVGTMLQFSPTFCNFLVHISNVIRDSAMPRWHTDGTSTGYAWACLMHMETMQHVLQTGTWSQAKDSWQCNSSFTGLSNLQQKADLVFVQIPS